MFRSARLKLTAFYVLAIMLISILFSIAVFGGATREFRRFAGVRISREQRGRVISAFPPPMPANMARDIEETELRLRIILILLNGGIFFMAVVSGYILSGRTLAPIKKMVDEQNRFITDASHELRTPLTSIRSETEVGLRDKKLNLKDAKDLLESNLEEIISIQALSDNLLTLSQSESMQSNFKKLHLLNILESAKKKVQPIANKKKIEIKISSKNFDLSGDEVTLNQLFVILLDNAIKYSDSGSRIDISTRKTDHSVLVEVIDHGSGVSKEDLPFIFDRFYRTDKSRSKLINGYGLGLSIAKKIIREHDGKINVKSELKKGTTFSVTLPLAHI